MRQNVSLTIIRNIVKSFEIIFKTLSSFKRCKTMVQFYLGLVLKTIDKTGYIPYANLKLKICCFAIVKRYKSFILANKDG